MSFRFTFSSPDVPAQAQYDLAVRAGTAGLVYPVVMGAICATTSYLQDHPYLFSIALLWSISAALWRLVAAKRIESGERSQNFYLAVQVPVILTCLNWGLFAAVTLQLYAVNAWSTSITLLASAAFAAGVTTSLSPDGRLAQLGISLILIPPVVSSLYLFNRESLVLGFMGLLYFAFLQHQAYQNANMYRKTLEVYAAEKARERAEASTQVKSEMIAVLSHEIRTPLNGLLGMLEIVQQSELTEDQRENLAMATLAGNGLVAVLNRILDYSKSEAEGKERVRKVEFRLDQCLSACLSTFRWVAKNKGLQFNDEIEPQIKRAYRGDPVLLGQVLNNLTSNAIKFTSTGSVTLIVKIVETTGVEDWVSFSVRDSGIGISAEAQQRIFHPFVQADETVQTAFGGTGLGLAISRQLVIAMGGTIEIASTPGTGSTFTFILPLERAAASNEGRPITLDAAPSRRSAKILVAEDNLVNQRMVVRMLERMGYEVKLVDNGLSALAEATATSFDLILMDCQMPQLDGFSATEQIRKLPHSSNVPVVALTASASAVDRDRAINSGMNAVLIKPYSFAQLSEIVDRYCA